MRWSGRLIPGTFLWRFSRYVQLVDWRSRGRPGEIICLISSSLGIPRDLPGPAGKRCRSRGMSRLPCLACCRRDPAPDKPQNMDGLMDIVCAHVYTHTCPHVTTKQQLCHVYVLPPTGFIVSFIKNMLCLSFFLEFFFFFVRKEVTHKHTRVPKRQSLSAHTTFRVGGVVLNSILYLKHQV